MDDRIKRLELEIEKLKLEIKLEKLRGKVVLAQPWNPWPPCVVPSVWEKPYTVADPPYDNQTWITCGGK